MLQRVSESLQRSLLEQPESGMGYQIADVDRARYLILDAAIAVEVPPMCLVPLLLKENSGQSEQGYFFVDEWGRHPVGWLNQGDAEELNALAAKWVTGEDPLSVTVDLPELDGIKPRLRTHGS